jgi:hypothetical protein
MAIGADITSSTFVISPADPRWDRYVESRTGAAVYHLGAWAQILQSAYGCRPCYLALERDGALRGVLPLMRSTGLMTGKRLRSLPVVPPAGPLGDTREDEAELLRAACAYAVDRKAALVVQSRADCYQALVPELVRQSRHSTWITRLPGDPDELRATWRKTSKNLHRSVGKAEKSGVTVRAATSEADLRAFYHLYVVTMKAHKALPRSYRQLAKARELLGPRGAFRLFLAEHDGRLVAGGVFHAWNGGVELLYNGSDPASLDLRPNHALYWHVIRWAIESGHHEFNWGEAKAGSSLERFKAQWSAEAVPEYRYDMGKPGDSGSRADLLRQAGDRMGRGGGASRRERLVAAAWEHAPLAVTRAAGAVAYRWL